MVDYIQKIMVHGSLFQVIVAVLFAGALASLSSCTLARLPVLLGLVSSGTVSKNRGFFLALAFACGLVISYTLIGLLLGAMAHVASKLVAVSQYLYLFLGTCMVLGGLFFAGLIVIKKISLQEHCQTAIKTVNSIPSAFVFGFLFAFLEMPACPCCGAVLLLIASLVAIKGSLIYSGLIFLSFAVGQSLPIVVVGLSSRYLKALIPKTHLMEGVISFVVGNLLIVSGIFLIALA